MLSPLFAFAALPLIPPFSQKATNNTIPTPEAGACPPPPTPSQRGAPPELDWGLRALLGSPSQIHLKCLRMAFLEGSLAFYLHLKCPYPLNRQFYFWKLSIYVSVQKYRLSSIYCSAVSSGEKEKPFKCPSVYDWLITG